MPDIKIGSDEATTLALAAVEEAVKYAKNDLDRAAAAVKADLLTRAEALTALSGLVERCRHVLVKDISIERDAVALSELRLRVGNYNEIQFVPYQGDRAQAPHLRVYDDKPKTYRFWLCIEEIGVEK